MADKFLDGATVKAGSTSVSMTFQLRKSADNTAETGKVAADLTISYLRQGSTVTDVTETDLAAVNSAYSSGGVKELDATKLPGVYRFDVPDAALATGVDWVEIYFKTAASWQSQRIALTTTQPWADTLEATVVETEGSYTFGQALSIMIAVLAGRTASSGLTFKTPNGNANRVVFTTDASRNRTASTVTPSS